MSPYNHDTSIAGEKCVRFAPSGNIAEVRHVSLQGTGPLYCRMTRRKIDIPKPNADFLSYVSIWRDLVRLYGEHEETRNRRPDRSLTILRSLCHPFTRSLIMSKS